MPGSDFLFVFIVVFQVQDPSTFEIALPFMHSKRQFFVYLSVIS